MRMYKDLNLVYKLCIQFMHENDCIQRYIKEYREGPNSYNSGNLINDLKASIKTSTYDGSPFHFKSKGWSWFNCVYGEDYWRGINNKFIIYLKENYKKYENIQF